MDTAHLLNISHILIAVGVIVGALGTLGTYYFGKKIEAEAAAEVRTAQQLSIEHVSMLNDSPTLDIQLRNAGAVPVSTMAAYAAVIDAGQGPSIVSKLKVSDKAIFELSEVVGKGSIISAPLAVKVAPNDIERIQLGFRWNGIGPKQGRYYVIVPAIRTSAGILRGPAVNLHFQEDFDLTKGASGGPGFPPTLISLDEANRTNIDWP